jgi:predicted HNH restriction endonuclease
MRCSADGDGYPDLAYIKTSNTGTGTVEVHIASRRSNFQTRIWESGTTFDLENDGTWLLAPAKSGTLPDLAFIKISNAATHSVEVHIASGASGYKLRTQETGTVFGEEDNGIWKLYDYNADGVLDLVYIKTSATGTNSVEVHVAAGPSYRNWVLHTGTTFAPETDGFWQLASYSGWNTADLVFIKDANTGTGQTEVHVASQASGYHNKIFASGSTFVQETNGVWSLIDFNKDGVLDLTYIKYQNTRTGKVEVHVASGK